MRGTVKRKEGELLDTKNVLEVAEKLDQGLISIREACAALKISYNPSRLDRIIEETKTKAEYVAQRRKALSRTPVSDSDKLYMVQSFFEGMSLSEIAENTFRTVQTVKEVLYDLHIPNRKPGSTYFDPTYMPDEMTRDSFAVGELVYSARYDSLAEIVSEYKPGVYKIWVSSDEQYAYQPAYELGSLEKATALGLKAVEHLSREDIYRLLNEALTKANKAKKNEQ